jgi:hypothetical protein
MTVTAKRTRRWAIFRVAVTAALCLAFGVTANFAVCCVCMHRYHSLAGWRYKMPRMRDRVFAWASVQHYNVGPDSWNRTEAGWPLRCWWGADIYFGDPENNNDRNERQHLLSLSSEWSDRLGVEELPTGIMPWPFVANTLMYAALPIALWLTFGPLRRWRRRRAGHCTRCNYNRAGLATEAPCPECGEPARS